jgi:D-3-phosphoglycerate dehydrogenase
MTLILALSYRLLAKDRLTRAGRWQDKLDYNGQGLTGRTLGIVGLGRIGAELARLAAAFDLRLLAFDPWAAAETAAAVKAELTSLDELLRRSDYVAICCALTPETHHLIDAARLAQMKPGAYLVNVARGPIVDQAALTDVLRQRRIAGAGLDVFEREPIDPDDPLLELDNVILAPHALAWTDECFTANGQSAVRSLLDVAAGRAPQNVVNRDALAHDRCKHLQP